VGLLALALVAIGVIYALSAYRIGKRYEIVPRDVEDGFTLLELVREHYRNVGLDDSEIDAMIR
jgi:hypothetical protein